MSVSIDSLTERDIAKTIDHSLLRPELDDAFIEDGCRLAAEYDVASVCVRPVDVRRAVSLLHGTDVAVGNLAAQPWALRVTMVFRREGGRWLLAHRHADPLVAGITVPESAALARRAPGVQDVTP